MSFRSLRVINEDRIAASSGFGTHPHKNMEIVTFVVSGSLTHKDSLGNIGKISPGEIQRMSAGSGIQHSEYNDSSDVECHLLQIWLLPNKNEVVPSWEQVHWSSLEPNSDGLRLLVSENGVNGSARIHQDAHVWHGKFMQGQSTRLILTENRGGWLQLISGSLTLNAKNIRISMSAGDGVAVQDENLLNVNIDSDSVFLWFDLP